MKSEMIVNELYKFLKTEVTSEKLDEAKQKAYPKEVKEGKLPEDPSLVKDPTGDIQKLAEEKKEKKNDGDIEPAEVTAEPKVTRIEAELAKQSPDVDKLTQDDKTGDIPEIKAAKNKEEKKITPEVTGVKKEKAENESVVNEGNTPKSFMLVADYKDFYSFVEDLKTKLPEFGLFVYDVPGTEGSDTIGIIISDKTMSPEQVQAEYGYPEQAMEGKLPEDPSQVKDPIGDVQKLAEEKTIGTYSDEQVAKSIQAKYPGSRVEPIKGKDGKNQAFVVVVQEAKVEETSVEVKTDDGKTVDVVATPTGVAVSTTDSTAQVTPVIDVPVEPVITEPVVVKDEVIEPELKDEEALEIAEKLFVTEFLKGKKQLSEKEQTFVKEVDAIKLSEKHQNQVNEKLSVLKGK